MIPFEEIKTLLREKSGKKLLLLSVAVFLLITVIVFFTVFMIYGLSRVKQMEEYLSEIPTIVESRENELLMRRAVCEEGYMTYADLGLILYREESDLTDAERLNRVRTATGADSVSLVDEQGALLSTTGFVSPEENVNACVQALEPRQIHLELYSSSKEGEKTGESDGRVFVRLPLKDHTNRSLVYEFPCKVILEVYNALNDWSNVLSSMLSGLDAVAFAKTGDSVVGYPMEGLTDDQTSKLYDDVAKVIEKGGFWNHEDGMSVKLIKLMGKRYFAVKTHYSPTDTEVLLTIPLMDVIRNGIFIAVTISAIIGWGILLIQGYIFRQLVRKKARNEEITISRRWVWQATWPGLLVMLLVTIIFSAMLLQLENRTNAAFTATTKRSSLQYEIEERKGLESTIRRTFEESYKTRTQALAIFLEEHPDYQTHEKLKELNSIAGSDYLMLFDREGQEKEASNSYTGFSVEKNLSEEYQAVLMGYPSTVVGPAADPYTGWMQIGTAFLMTDEEEKADGFLLAVYSAGDLNREIERMSLESTVNNFAVQKDHIAAAIKDKDGLFVAHTDPMMIGQNAKDFLDDDFQTGVSFEGYTEYMGRLVCVSAVSLDGKTLLFIVPERGDLDSQSNAVLIASIILLILALLYYPNAGLLIAKAMEEAEGNLQSQDRKRNPIVIFSDGYAIFLAPFALIALWASSGGWWTSFDYVFSGMWTKGVHLFSVWAALFVTAVTLFFEFLIRVILNRMESRFSNKARTITRLFGSFITYSATIFLFISVFSMFGVDTKVLMASAGVVSIAVGMGAQSMAGDLLAGFFMMLEGTVHVGDYVSVGGSRSSVTGRVVDMGVRTMKIVDKNGNLVTLNNREASPVTNMNHMMGELEDGVESDLEYAQENGKENGQKNNPENRLESGKENDRKSGRQNGPENKRESGKEKDQEDDD